jgi:hypothetical protein
MSRQKRANSLEKLRNKWKNGFSAKLKEPALETKNSIRTLRGGLPGSAK